MAEPTPPAYRVRRIRPGEWRELRALRLEALRVAPTAFSTTYVEAETLPDDVWRAQAVSAATGASSALFVAVPRSADATGGDGPWLGMAGAAPIPDVPDHAHVHTVYVAPAHRGRVGPAAELVAAVIAFARDHIDVGHLTLGVHESNTRAQSFYRRLGFVPTGLEVPYPLNPAEHLHIFGYPHFRAPR